MANALKVTMNFSMAPLPGWSESWYAPDGPIDATLLAKINALAQKRILCLVSIAQITSLRVAAVPARRFARHFRRMDLRGADTRLRDVAATTAQVNVYTANGHSRSVQIHGLADNATDFLPDGGPNPVLNNGLVDYLAAVKAGAWLVQVETVNAFDPLQALLKPLTDITWDAVNGLLVVTVAGLAAVPKDHVLLSGLQGLKVGQLRGEWTVASYTDPTLKLATRRNIDPTFVLSPKVGFVRLKRRGVFYGYEAVSDYSLMDVIPSSRRVGRPPDAPRGRRSRR